MKTTFPSVGFYFQIILDNQAYSFKEVSGISSDIDTEEIAEVENNRFKYRIPANPKYNNLELKRGLIPKNSNLFLWLNNSLNSDLIEPITPKTVAISLLNEEAKLVMSWDFIDVCPVGCISSSFSGQDDEILIESINLSFSHFANKRIE